ncbi:hypothetical protein [Blastopirellula marina]|uniref:Uncharacterized protein n=1 Tax=Blastopirellula marina TaxID=124 RepID=A0A2S8F7P2_9BACT|nr:hypothetical protein [Blastopirellula marina]PQO28168.1 hypothetical protein C5Y98_25015 [Blastopirellula marina]PTL41708.1 hypothetical protein C5Y97_25030 [Blastopirellula marina]
MATGEHQAENENDAPYLYVLEIFYYILGALSLFSCFPNLMRLHSIQVAENHMSQILGSLPPDLQSHASSHRTTSISGIALFIIGLTLAVGIGQVFTASSLKSRRNHTFCLVIAGLSCFLGTLGTAVGVATFLVLVRPSVKRLFAQPTL